jgi:hypothetical protein
MPGWVRVAGAPELLVVIVSVFEKLALVVMLGPPLNAEVTPTGAGELKATLMVTVHWAAVPPRVTLAR